MSRSDELVDLTHAIARAIARRDVTTLTGILAPGFVYRTPDGQSSSAAVFLTGVADIPGEIAFVKVEHVQVEIEGDGALVTGMQHAQLSVDGSVIDDRRAFVDFFVRMDNAWRLRVAVDFGAVAPS